MLIVFLLDVWPPHRYDPVHGNGGSPILVDDKLINEGDMVPLLTEDGRRPRQVPVPISPEAVDQILIDDAVHAAGLHRDVDALLDDPELRSQDRLGEGEMIFIDNRWTLHGRVEFQDSDQGHQRLMLRTWIAADVS